jgi:hypothetical protein
MGFHKQSAPMVASLFPGLKAEDTPNREGRTRPYSTPALTLTSTSIAHEVKQLCVLKT